tara:strand:- start:359 stop:541 length:183 start_codon:yes stop_codon:yes gene_type:complete
MIGMAFVPIQKRVLCFQNGNPDASKEQRSQFCAAYAGSRRNDYILIFLLFRLSMSQPLSK